MQDRKMAFICRRMSRYSPSHSCLDGRLATASFGRTAGFREGYEQLDEPEQPQSPFMVADGIAVGIDLIDGLYYR